MKEFCILIVFLVQFYSALSQNAAQPDKDTAMISIQAIPYPCVVLDDAKEVKVLSRNSVLMTAGKQTDLHNPADGSYFRHNAPKFLFSPDGDFDFSARVKPTFDQLYDGGAILVYSDVDNWAKILFQNVGDKLILGNSVVKNKITDDSYFHVHDLKEIYLRVTKKGKVFNFYASPDGKTWNLVREFVYHKPEQMRIGFYSQSPVGNQCAVEYSDIRFTGADK